MTGWETKKTRTKTKGTTQCYCQKNTSLGKLLPRRFRHERGNESVPQVQWRDGAGLHLRERGPQPDPQHLGGGGAGKGRLVVPAGQESSAGQVRSGGNLSLCGVRIPRVVRPPGVRRQVTLKDPAIGQRVLSRNRT